MNASFSGALLRSLQLFGQMSFSQSLTDFTEYLKLEGITSYLRPGNESDAPNKLFELKSCYVFKSYLRGAWRILRDREFKEIRGRVPQLTVRESVGARKKSSCNVWELKEDEALKRDLCCLL